MTNPLTAAINKAIANGAPVIVEQTKAKTMLFRDLPIGATFDFVPPDASPGAVSFFDRCQKTSARLYQSLRFPNAYPYQVGTVACRVYHVGDMQSSGDARLSVAVDRLDKNTAIESYDRNTRKSTDTEWPDV